MALTRSSNRHMAAFARHVGCNPKAMDYPEGETGSARCGDCGATWPLDLSRGGYRFAAPLHPGLADAR